MPQRYIAMNRKPLANYRFGSDFLPQNHDHLKMLWMLITSAVKHSSQHAVKTLLRTPASLPVTVATNERSVCSLKRLKSYLRNSMAESSLNCLALFNIHLSIACSALFIDCVAQVQTVPKYYFIATPELGNECVAQRFHTRYLAVCSVVFTRDVLPHVDLLRSSHAKPVGVVVVFTRDAPLACRYRFRLRDTHCVMLSEKLLHYSPPTRVEPSSILGRVAPEFSHVGIVPDDAAGRRVFSVFSHLPGPFIPIDRRILPDAEMKHPLVPRTPAAYAGQMAPLANNMAATWRNLAWVGGVAKASLERNLCRITSGHYTAGRMRVSSTEAVRIPSKSDSAYKTRANESPTVY
ncbi:hypothetical protein PR048_000004 [Dryococelus australis]|uniref:Uncharacterized protein n=1 Tax=Dryococelus australis TaxID=614101 RepID=A0ABQ9IDZ8_9NEOP|nr:hypothetical protein PR048_000004 [Dryococelus australis]